MATATEDQISQIRTKLGERIPQGGDESDTLFTDAEIQEFFELGSDDVLKAIYHGWLAKAAELANLVDTAEGNYSRKFSQLLDHANSMIKYYGRASGGDALARTRIGKIQRS
jgi:hypothetical protein